MRRVLAILALVLLCLGLEATFLSLAHWQYNRMLSAQALQHQTQPTFTVRGAWVSPTVSIVLDNQPNPQNPEDAGWRLLTLYQPDEARALFLDRGWLPFPPDRLTADNLPCAPNATTPTSLEVQLHTYPTQRGRLRGPITTTDSRIYAFLAPQTAYPEMNQTEYLTTTTATCAATVPLPPPTRNPARHQSYMMQWLGLALVTPALFLSLLIKRRRQKP